MLDVDVSHGSQGGGIRRSTDRDGAGTTLSLGTPGVRGEGNRKSTGEGGSLRASGVLPPTCHLLLVLCLSSYQWGLSGLTFGLPDRWRGRWDWGGVGSGGTGPLFRRDPEVLGTVEMVLSGEDSGESARVGREVSDTPPPETEGSLRQRRRERTLWMNTSSRDGGNQKRDGNDSSPFFTPLFPCAHSPTPGLCDRSRGRGARTCEGPPEEQGVWRVGCRSVPSFGSRRLFPRVPGPKTEPPLPSPGVTTRTHR